MPLAIFVAAAVSALLGSSTNAAAQPAAYRCPVTFYVEDARPPIGIGELVFDVAYEPPALRFVGVGTSVACTKIVPNTLAIFDDDGAGVLHVDLSSAQGISSFIQLLAVCTTESAEVPVAGDFEVTLVEETQVGGAPVTPPVVVQVLLPIADDCEPVAFTTTSTTTTTTIPPVSRECGDPNEDSAITATDALITLNAAVGLNPCVVCVCDVDGSTSVTASDALLLLKLAVGQPFELACAPCPIP